MVFNVYSIYDNCVKEFRSLFVAKNDEVAKRIVSQMKKEDLPNVKDYSLYRLGNFENEDVERESHLVNDYQKISDVDFLLDSKE